MAGNIPNPLWLYRIIHFGNLDFILKCGLYVRGHKNFDPNYINIGNPDIIGVRDSFKVMLDDHGKIGEYIPFYFGKQSIMLYNILTGYGIKKHAPEDIVYLCCEINNLTSTCNRYFFTDGQANKEFTEHFNDLKDLDKIDWNVVMGKDFMKSAADTDKPRRYQAEFLVHEHVPTSCIKKIIVYNQKRKTEAQEFLLKNELEIPVKIVKEGYYFHF